MSAETYLGFDVGERRLGVAVGESVTGSSRPLTTLNCHAGEPDWAEIQQLVENWRPVGLVVGIPRHTDDSASHSTRLAERFSQRLVKMTNLAVHAIDERLSSREAEIRLRDAGKSLRQAKARGLLDRVAAQVILETWLRERPTP